MTDSPPEPRVDEIVIRLAEEADHASVHELFCEGMDEGQLRKNDTGADIENLFEAYFADDGASGFWVACHDGQVVGMIGVQKTRQDTAEIRRLRVCEEFRRRRIGSLLLEEAMTFCRKHDYLKVVLDVRIERAPAIGMFEKSGFHLSRSVDDSGDGHSLLEFYMDLYREPEG